MSTGPTSHHRVFYFNFYFGVDWGRVGVAGGSQSDGGNLSGSICINTQTFCPDCPLCLHTVPDRAALGGQMRSEPKKQIDHKLLYLGKNKNNFMPDLPN